VEVNVKDGLMRHRPVVLEDIALLGPCDSHDRAAEPGEDASYRGGGVIGELVECSDLFLRNH
jgi:hypothetical protein